MTPRRPAGDWTPDQVFDAMVEIAAADAERWASSAYAAIEALLSAAPPETGPALLPESIDIAGRVCLGLIEHTDRVADGMGATPDQRRRFIVARVEAYRARLTELLNQPTYWGTA